jgi:hypothetical protein
MQTGVNLGALIWETGPPRRASKGTMSLLIVGLLVAGVLLTKVILPPYFASPDGLRRSEFWRGTAFVLLFFAAAAVLSYRTFFVPRSIGVRFFQHGIVVGTTAGTRAVGYGDLEYFCFLPYSTPAFAEFFSIARFVMGIVTLDPSSLVSASDSDVSDPPIGKIVLKVPSEKEIGIPINSHRRYRLSMLLDGLPQHRPGE